MWKVYWPMDRQTDKHTTKTGDQKSSFQLSVQVSLKMKYLIISDSWKSWCLLRGQILYVMWCPMTQDQVYIQFQVGISNIFKISGHFLLRGIKTSPYCHYFHTIWWPLGLDTKIKNILWFRGGDPNFFQRYLSTSCFKGVLITIF